MKGQRMPNEHIAQTVIDNGPGKKHTNVLRILWGERGGQPDAPRGWVNAGYAHVMISKQTETTGEGHVVELDPVSMKKLIKTLKRIQRQAFRGRVG